MDKLSIVILNFNSGKFLIECLDSVKEAEKEADLEIFVVDNASTDESVENSQKKYPKFEYILNSENLGFSKANNMALKKIKNEFILLLNPDCVLKKGVLIKMLEVLRSDPMIGAATCKIILSNGIVDLTAHRGFPTPWASFLYHFFKDDSLYHLSNADMSKLHEVDSIAGAFFLTRKSILEKVGYFDEDFFLYGEDIDLCFRIKKAGFEVVYEPSVEIIHNKGVSSGLKKHSKDLTQADKQTRTRAFNSFYESMKIFYKKHYEKNYPSIVNWLVYLGINLKEFLARKKMEV